MKSPNKGMESENLAERLRSLYKTYNCENELPVHDDLVAKLDGVKPEVRDAIKMELDRDYVYPISEEEAKIPLSQKFMALYAFTLAKGIIYAEEKRTEKGLKQDNFPFLLHAVYGGIKAFPLVVKAVLTPEDPKGLMEEHNVLATRCFWGFKRNVEYCVLSEPFERNQSNSKNRVQN